MKRGIFSGIHWPGFTTQLFAVVVLPLAFLTIVIAFGGLSLHRQAMRTMVGERDERAVRAAASAMFEQLSHREKAVRGLALLAGTSKGTVDLQTVLESSDYLHLDFDYGLAFITRSGELLADVGPDGFWDAFIAASPAFQEAIARDAPPAFLSLEDPVSGDRVVLTFAREAKGTAAAVGAFDPAGLAADVLLGTFISDPSSSAALVDTDRNILFESGDFGVSEPPGTHPGVLDALNGTSGTIYVPVQDGEHVVSFSPVESVGWALVIEEPWEEVTSPLLQTTEYAPFVLIPAFVLVLVALWFGLRQIVLPLQALESRAVALGAGNYGAIEQPVGGIAEIRHLQKELIRLAHRVRAAQAGLRGYIGAITTAQEEERRRLARELHDDTLQALIALNQRIHLARLENGDAAETGTLTELQALTTTTIENLRRLTRALRPIYLEDLGLVAALEVLSRETEDLSSVSVTFRRTGSARRLPASAELALYRIAQEALNNVVRHAEASSCRLEIEFTDKLVRLVVVDDGVGFLPPENPAELAPQGHFGLLGLHERAELIGAELKIHSEPGEGTAVEIALKEPLHGSSRPPRP